MSTTSTQHIKALVVDENERDRELLITILEEIDCEVIIANDGAHAVKLFKQERPHLILLDVSTSVVDSKQVATQIKQFAGSDFIPILFLTSIQDVNEIAACLAAGGDDFLAKPYSRVILKAKINALIRMRTMHVTVQSQRDELSEHQSYLLRDQVVAKAVFDNVTHSGCLGANNIKYMLSPLALFNGDVLLAAEKPTGGMFILLGDFTGHGLSAAIGAMPLAEAFYSMSAKGYSIEDIASELNMKLKSILPIGVFCCACLVDISFTKQIVKIWSGGMPDCFLFDSHSLGIRNISSRHLPLGILSDSRFNADSETFEMPTGSRLLLCTDGVSEASNDQGEVFGEDRIVETMRHCDPQEGFFEGIHSAIHDFIANSSRNDDITLAEIKMVGNLELDQVKTNYIRAEHTGPVSWSMDYELAAASLRRFNPLPLMLHILMELPELRVYSGQIYTILSELFSNALEHGILGLDSKIKSSVTGFVAYYKQREELLKVLDEGYIRFHFEHSETATGGKLVIRLQDSGAGFDSAALELNASHGVYSNRGIPLVLALCDSLEFLGNGNTAEVVFNWTE